MDVASQRLLSAATSGGPPQAGLHHAYSAASDPTAANALRVSGQHLYKMEANRLARREREASCAHSSASSPDALQRSALLVRTNNRRRRPKPACKLSLARAIALRCGTIVVHSKLATYLCWSLMFDVIQKVRPTSSCRSLQKP